MSWDDDDDDCEELKTRVEDLDGGINEIINLVESACKPEVVDLSAATGQRKSLIYRGCDEPREIEHVDQPRNHRVDNINAMIDATAVYGVDNGVLWCDAEKEVVLIADDASRCCRVTLPLSVSDQFAELQGQHLSMKHRGFMRFLKLTMKECGGPDYAPTFASMTFRDNRRSSSGAGSSSGSMGREVEQEAQSNGAAVPDYLTFEVPVYRNYSFRCKVTCYLEVDVEQQEFTLRPIPGHLESGKADAIRSIADALAVTTRPVFIGSVNE